MSTQQGNPDQPDDSNKLPKQPQVLLPQRDTVTNLQVSILLNIGAMLSGILLNPMRESEDSNWKDKKQLDGGISASAETTFINICSKLDEILADGSRWTFEAQNKLEDSLSKIYAQQLLFLQAQTAEVKFMSKPHRRYNPKLLKLTDGSWAAILGDTNNLDNAILGAGATPAEALEVFDGMFTGDMPENLLRILAEQDKLNQQHENNTVDRTRSLDVKSPAKTRRNSRRINTQLKPDSGSDSKQTPGIESPEAGGPS